MTERNKAALESSNAAITEGDIEGFLAFCTDDIEWITVGEEPIEGKGAVRRWMQENYVEPPRFEVTRLIGEGDFVVALGTIVVDAESPPASYCDVWRFRDGKMASLQAFVVSS